MKSIKLFVLFCTFFQSLYAQDTLEIDRQHPENVDLAIKIISVNNRFGIANDTGKVLMPPKFEQLEFFVADTNCTNWKGIIKARQGGMYALVGIDGVPITPMDYEEIYFFPTSCQAEHKAGLVARVKKFRKYGLVNHKGHVLIRPSYQNVELLTDQDGKLVTPEVARVQRNNFYGLMELRSQKVMKTEYEKIEFLQTLDVLERKKKVSTTILTIQKKGKLGIKNLQNQVETPALFEEIHTYDSVVYMAKVKKGKKYGFIDLAGRLKFTPNFDYAEDFRSGVAIVGKKNKFGTIKSTGKPVIPLQYSDVRFVIENPDNQINKLNKAIFVRKGNLYGVMDTEGEILIPVQYDKITFSAENQNFEAEKGGKTEIIRL